ncbi:MAG: radical SAM protein [Lachnospiraceae bacterium]
MKEPEHITSYTIFTTTDCNARCFYCYEMGRSRIPMSDETAHKAAAYIAAHCGGEKVHLHWFGGEPLFNKQVIDIICTDLAEKGIVYESMIISNGYLFDGATVEQAVSHWKLKNVQITLDGTEEIYNRSKAFIYKDGTKPLSGGTGKYPAFAGCRGFRPYPAEHGRAQRR